MPEFVKSIDWQEIDLWTEVLGNSLWRWGAAVITFFVVGTLLRLVRRFGEKRRPPGNPQTLRQGVMVVLARLARLPSFVFAFAAGAAWLALAGNLDRIRDIAVVVAVGIQLGIFLSVAVRIAIDHEAQSRSLQAEDLSSLGVLRFIAQLGLWALVLLLVLSNLGVDVTAFVASLGIGGVAVALAAQNVLGDLFASLSIVLDKPFRVGDFIIVGGELGTVRAIGMKTTRVASLGGEEIVFSNSDLLSSRIRNYKKMRERRVVFRFGVLYSTPAEKLEAIAKLCREAVQEHSDLRFDRAHFAAFGASSLDFEVVYYVLSGDYTQFMDRQQDINLFLFRRIQSEGVEFAFPTQTVHVASWPSNGAPSMSPSGGPGVSSELA